MGFNSGFKGLRSSMSAFLFVLHFHIRLHRTVCSYAVSLALTSETWDFSYYNPTTPVLVAKGHVATESE